MLSIKNFDLYQTSGIRTFCSNSRYIFDASIIDIHRIIEHLMKAYNNQVKANVMG